MTLAKFISETSTDADCRTTYASAIKPNAHFNVDSDGVLVWVSALNSVSQRVVNTFLCLYFLQFRSYTLLVGHSGKRRVYVLVRKGLYQPHIGNDVFATVRDCHSREQNRNHRKDQRKLKLFSPKPIVIRLYGKARTSTKDVLMKPTCRHDDRPLNESW